MTQLFPVDSYTYYMQYQCQCDLNFGSMSVNGVNLVPNQTTPNIMNYSITGSVIERIDQNAWILKSSALFTPAKGNQPAYLTITLHISRNPNQVVYPIIIPLLALYGILSISILATRKDDLANRLLIYISIFIFSYGFLNYVASLIVSPLTIGANMVDLLTYALIPCTAILAGCSFLRWIPWIRVHENAADFADFMGIALASLTLLIETTFSLNEYEPVQGVLKLVPVQYGLSSLGWFGAALFLLLVSGAFYPIVRMLFRTDYVAKRRLMWRLRSNSHS